MALFARTTRLQAATFTAAMDFLMGGLAALFLVVATQSAVAQGPYYELVETVIDPNNDPNWPTVSDGHITLKDVNGTYNVEYSWSPPPRTSDSAGFDVNLKIEGKATPNRVYAGIGMNSPSGGFSFDKDPASADISVPDAAAGGSESRSNGISVHVTPSTAYADGSIIELRIGAFYAYGVTYRYRVSATPVIIDDPQQPQEGPLMVTVDCPTDIVIGALPSLNCYLLISGYRRNTADPVEVIVPNMLDQFGNHANGIQVVDLDGAQDVFNWSGTYSWGFFVYACQAPNIGANCYENVATPGPATVPVVVQQAGLQPVNLMLTFNVIARAGTGGGLGQLGNQVYIGSRWISSTFINVESGTPSSTTILLDWLSARWTLDPVEGGYVRIHSVWKPDQYLHIENGPLEAGPIQPEWLSALWVVEPSGGGYFMRFRNAWKPELYINVETGSLQVSPIAPDWLSADWWLLQ